MKKDTQYIWIIVAMVILSVGLFVWFTYFNKPSTGGSGGGTNTGNTDTVVPPPPNTPSTAIPGTRVLKYGTAGRKVAVLQALLNHYKGENLKIDGDFRYNTSQALIRNGYCTSTGSCEMSLTDFVSLLELSANDNSFKTKYSPNTNADMKAVYAKYSS